MARVRDYTNFFLSSTTVAGALTGLLFVVPRASLVLGLRSGGIGTGLAAHAREVIRQAADGRPAPDDAR